MANSRKKTTDPVLQICQSDEAKVVRELLTKFGDKWSIVGLVILSRVPGKRARFSELQTMMTGISQRMLTTTLRTLERDGLVVREVFPEVPPRVEYEVTALGLSLLEPMEALVQWIGGNWPAIRVSRERFDRKR